MGLFNQRKPRGFHHEYMFIDTRKERLKAMEEHAKKELEDANKPVDGRRLERGVFLKATRHASKRSGHDAPGGMRQTMFFIVLLALLLLLMWRFFAGF